MYSVVAHSVLCISVYHVDLYTPARLVIQLEMNISISNPEDVLWFIIEGDSPARRTGKCTDNYNDAMRSPSAALISEAIIH
jgi:hypothetical protein